MGDSTLNQLIELFPKVSEEFLKGIYDTYREEDVNIEEIIDVILSFEYPPLTENYEQNLIENSFDIHGALDNNESDFSELVVTCVKNNKSLENKTVEVKAVGSASGGEHLILKKSSDDNQSLEVQDSLLKNVTDKTACEGNNQIIANCETVCEINGEAVTNKESNCLTVFVKTQSDGLDHSEINYSNCLVKEEWSEEEEEDSSPEYSIRYLMIEENDHLKEDRCSPVTYKFPNVEFHEEDKDCEVTFSENSKHSTSKFCEKQSPLSSANASNAFELGSPNKGDSNSKNDFCLSKKNSSSNIDRKSTVEMSSQPDVRKVLTRCSSKRATLRSCKVKNAEYRLKKKLQHKNRLLLVKLEKNANSSNSPSQFESLDSKYALLCKVFPDADTSYLLDQCHLLTDQDKILKFISQYLEFRDYPKAENKKGPIFMEHSECTIEEFLKVIPDPVADFSSRNYIRSGYKENAEIYLKARYERLSAETVKERLKSNGYNMTSVCAQLESEGFKPTPGVLDYTPLHHQANVFFHQEVWFIEHRAEIQNYLDSTIEAVKIQEEINRPPPPVEEVFECEICSDEIVEYIQLGTCEASAGHLFCKNCIKRSAEVRIGDGHTTFPCLTNCGAFIPLQTIQELLPDSMYTKLMGRIQEEEIRKANIPGVETCPFCPYAYGPGEDEVFSCLNPSCLKLSCRVCRKEDHSPEMCDIFKKENEETARHIIENRMAEALMRQCYSCKKNFVKSGGCNKMVCSCGAKMCYICRQPVVDYTHFNGQGGDNLARCPLFSADEDLHIRPVEETARQVFNELAANNPELNLDQNTLIPK